MQLDHQFTIPQAPNDVFALLLDVERIAPCLPGAELSGRDGDSYTGSIRVKVGPLVAAYEGTATIEGVDEEERRAVLVASGSEVGGQGGADARVQLEVHGENGTSEVGIHTDLDIRGRAAQFGRGVLDDVAGRIVQQFATNLQATLTAPAPAGAVATETAAPEASRTAPARHEAAVGAPAAAEPLDLLEASWEPMLRRSLPYLVAVLVGIVLGRLFGRGPAGGAPGAVYVVPSGWSVPGQAAEPAARRERSPGAGR